MISFAEAYSIVTTNLPLMPTETVDIHFSMGRVLAADISSDMDMPPFDKAAVDGYACRMADLDAPLRLIELIAAGKVPEKEVKPNCCSKIMTGAMVPQGADCVVMVEHTRMADAETVVVENTKTKRNIARKAEDIQKGAIVVPQGTLIKPQHIAVMASVGAVEVKVHKQVSVQILSTGDELVEPDQVPGPGEIRNSNALQLVMQAQRMGCAVQYGGIVADTETACRAMISKAVSEHDVVILTGGISMGDFDYVPAILKDLGMDLLFKSVAVQPGRPSVFARSADKFVFALPGNPVSAFNIFELLAKPFLYRLMGHAYEAPAIKMPLAEPFSRRNDARLGFTPASINALAEVAPISYHGSAHINALTHANALVEIPVGVSHLKKGDLVDVRLI